MSGEDSTSYRPSTKWKLAVPSASRFCRRWSAGWSKGDQMLVEASKNKTGTQDEHMTFLKCYDRVPVSG